MTDCSTRQVVVELWTSSTRPQAGELAYRQRLDIGELFSSPTLAGGQIYYGGRDGKMLVLRAGRKYDEIATNESERLFTSPAFEGGRMYLRADQFLYCIGK